MDKPTSPDSDTFRCFVGIPVDAAFVASVQPLVAQMQAQSWSRRVRWIAPRNWHITLAFLGNQPALFRQELHDHLRVALQQTTPFILNARWASGFPDARSRIVALEFHTTPALLQLKAVLDEQLRLQGFEPEQRALRPHLTLARFQRDQSPYVEPVVCAHELAAVQVNLYRSLMTPAGSEYQAVWKIGLPSSGAPAAKEMKSSDS